MRDKKHIVGRFEAWGGPAAVVLNTNPKYQEEPTTDGTYIIGRSHAYVTPTYSHSKIKWGTHLKLSVTDKDDVLYELPGGAWGSMKKDHAISRHEIEDWYYALYEKRVVPPTWVFNDFGPIAIRWFKDTNGNKKLDGNERLSGQMFHTTPINEAETMRKLRLRMVPSHGCIHLKPIEREKLIQMGAFKPGTTFIIHKYYDHI